ncbi:MAG: hypothetical protein WC788_07370 [Candidatus Paceibacterota bacterium]|jgi:hypothetical protein
MNKKIIIPVAIVFVVAVLGGGYFYWSQKSQNQKPKVVETPVADESKKTDDVKKEDATTDEVITDSATKGTLPSIQTNPLEEKPDLNPVDKTNPYKDIKTNPFK